MKTKPLIGLAAIVVSLAAAAAGVRGAAGGESAVAPTATTAAPASEAPTPLQDWCGSMRLAFGDGTGVPTTQAAYRRSMADGAASPEVAYVSLLEGIPDPIGASYATLRAAGDALVDGRAVGDPAAVMSAAAAVDGFVATNCGP